MGKRWNKFKKGFGKGAKEFFVGKPEVISEIPLGTKEQREFTQANLKKATDLLNSPLAPNRFSPQLQQKADFGPTEQRYRQDFAQNVIPSIAERFATGGAQRSSAFQNALGSAGANLSTELAALKAQHDMQQNQMLNQSLLQQQGLEQNQQNLDAQQLARLSALGMTPQVDTRIQEAQPGLFSKFGQGLGSLASMAPQLLAAYATGGTSVIPGMLASSVQGQNVAAPQSQIISQQPIAPQPINAPSGLAPAAQVNPGYNQQQSLPSLDALGTFSNISSQPVARLTGRNGVQASYVGTENPQFSEGSFNPKPKMPSSLNILSALSDPYTYNPQLKALLAAQGGMFK